MELPYSPGDLALLAALSTLVLIIFVNLLLRLCRASLKSACKRLLSFGSALAGALFHGLSDSGHSEAESAVAQKLRQCQVELFGNFLQGLCWLLLPWTLNRIYLIVSQSPRIFTQSQEVVHVMVQAVSVLGVVRPQLGSRAVDALYVVLMLLASACVWWQAVSKQSLVIALVVANPPVLFMTTVQLSPRRTLLPTLLFAGCSGWSLWQVAALQPRYIFAMTQLLLQATAVACSAIYERGLERKIRRSMQLQECREVQAAAAKLLRSSCDVVLELDGEGAIVEGAADLASLLLRGPSVGPERSRLVDYIEGEGKAEFQERLQRPRMGQLGLAESLLVSMRDGSGHFIRAELLWVQFQRMDGGRCMLGMREQPLHVERPMGAGESLPEGVTVSGEEDWEASLVVDATLEGLPVKSCSQAFVWRICRLHPGTRLLSKVSNPAAFEAWLDRNLCGQDNSNVCFKLRTSKAHFRCVCQLQGGADHTHVRLLFRSSQQLQAQSPTLKGTPTAAPLPYVSL